jgi:hypothetical protein
MWARDVGSDTEADPASRTLLAKTGALGRAPTAGTSRGMRGYRRGTPTDAGSSFAQRQPPRQVDRIQPDRAVAVAIAGAAKRHSFVYLGGMDRRWARPWFAATAAAALVGLIIQIGASSGNASVFGGTPLGRSLNIFAFFTIQSNVILGATALLLAINPSRSSAVFRVFRMMGLIGITVTFVVFHVALSHLLELDTWAEAANQLQHTVVPVLAIVGWLAFGPRGLTSAGVAKLSVLFPACYMAFALIRGAFDGFYPYPFANVTNLGYLKVVINGFWISLLFVGLAAGATALDRRLAPPTSAAQPVAP